MRRIAKDVIYGQLASDSRQVGRSVLRLKDACKSDRKAYKIDIDTRKATTGDCARKFQYQQLSSLTLPSKLRKVSYASNFSKYSDTFLGVKSDDSSRSNLISKEHVNILYNKNL